MTVFDICFAGAMKQRDVKSKSFSGTCVSAGGLGGKAAESKKLLLVFKLSSCMVDGF